MARILIVEDEVIVARSVAKLLAINGHEVPACVTTGADAIAAAASLRPDLILMDINLRGPLDGIDASHAIRSDSDVPIVFLTAYGDRGHLDRAKVSAPHGYLIKPYSDRDLLAMVEVTLHKAGLERELLERERWLGTLLRSIGEGVVAVGPDGKVLTFNLVAEQLTGWTDGEARGRPLEEILPLRDETTGQPRTLPLSRAIEERSVLRPSGPTVMVTRDGRDLPIDHSVAAIIDDGQHVLGTVVVFRDISERRMLESRLALSERMASLATLTSGMGHELNNPLNYNLGNLQLAVERLPALRKAAANPAAVAAFADELEETLRDALSGADRMREVLAALRELSSPDSPETHRVSLLGCVKMALRLTGNEIQQYGRLEIDVRARPEVEGHEGRLVQVFTHLLLNAAQAMPAGQNGEVRVVVDQDDDDAFVEISDTGSGIPPELMVRIFEPFFTTKPQGTGNGLGLAIAHNILVRHGGDISVRSKVGAGTTVRVTLPRPQPVEPPVVIAPAPTSVRRRVLVVDDEPLLLRMFAHVLSSDHEVVTAPSAADALEQIARQRPDVVVTDLMMPKVTGIDLYEQVRAGDAALGERFLFVTGGAFTDRAQRFVSAMGDRVLFKPLSPDDLLAAVARVLA